MQLTTSKIRTTRLSRAAARRGHHAVVPRRVVSAAQAQVRRAGGPQDRALYACGCGMVFTASVTASVGCPHCGVAQPW